MTFGGLTDHDLQQLAARGMDPDDVMRQLALLADPPGFARLNRPCTAGDGIERIPPERERTLVERATTAAAGGRLSRFVPASGAASRMFDALLRAQTSVDNAPPDAARQLMDALPRFAFRGALADAARAQHLDLDRLLASGDWRRVVALLLDAPGLDCNALPKGLLLFHHAGGGARTAFEEHLREAAAHVTSADGRCRQHFTVSPEHRARFAALLAALRPTLEAELHCRLEVGLSVQDPATDTVAVELDNRPFRTPDGALLLRPGGHGALLRNLQAFGGDVVVVKNIDNILPGVFRTLAVHWKKLLTGLLLELQDEIHACLRELRRQPTPEAAVKAARLARRCGHTVPEGVERRPGDEQAPVLAGLLDRPLRVCGMVRNEGEPGGGPYWALDSRGVVSPQIVEGSQIDPGDPGQQAVLHAATHFNPVDLVCGLRDAEGRPYDLTRFVDERAVFISSRSHAGRPLKALERPGLWNGAMAFWSTVFVEVPAATFAPVKTVFDLLRPEHQA